MDFNKKTAKDLKEMCKERGLKGYSSKTKGELVDLLTTGLQNELRLTPPENEVIIQGERSNDDNPTFAESANQKFTLDLLNKCAESAEATIVEYYNKNMETISSDKLSYHSYIRFTCKCGVTDCKQFRYIYSNSGSYTGMFCKRCTESIRKEKRTFTLISNETFKRLGKRKVVKQKIKIISKKEQELRKWRDDLEIKRNHLILDDKWYTHPELTQYEANTQGELRNKENGRILSGATNKKGRTTFNIAGKKQKHRFIMECLYNIKIPREFDIDHIDANPGNNAYKNLKILTKKEHSQKTADDNPLKGSNTSKHKGKSIKCKLPDGTEKMFVSISEARRTMHISYTQIHSSLNNEKEDYRGNKWSWVVNQEKEIEGEQWIESSIKKDLFVSNKGRVWFKYLPKQRKTYGTLGSESEYYSIGVSIDDKIKPYQVHRLIALAFIGSPPTPLHTVDHIDKNPTNNCVENLRWATPQEQSVNRTYVRKIESYDADTFEIIKIFESARECAKEYNMTNSGVGHCVSLKKGNYYINTYTKTKQKISVRYSDLSIPEKRERELAYLNYQLKLVQSNRKKRNNAQNLPLHICKNRDGYLLKISFRGEEMIKYSKDIETLVALKKQWLEEKYLYYTERINSLIN